MPDLKLDCKGQSCPMPIVNISRAIKKMDLGQVLEVEATDPAFRADLEAWCNKLGHSLVSFVEGAPSRATVRKAA
jgi:tRNA 2-thiouridine synthesizing protein A